MICIIALIVFGILGIFSAKYRTIAKEAFDCVFRKITLRKCESRLDSRLKAELSGKLMRKSKRAGEFLFKHFEWFSWALLILTLASAYYTGLGVYNYAVYGNCNGENSNQFCIFDPLGTAKPTSQNSTAPLEGTVCPIHPLNATSKPLTLPNKSIIDEAIRQGAYKGNPRARVRIIEFGCYECHYTRAAEPTVNKIIEQYPDEVLYIFLDFPLGLTHANAIRASQAVRCALDQGSSAYWQYRAYVFANQQKLELDQLILYAEELQRAHAQAGSPSIASPLVASFDSALFEQCLRSQTYLALAKQHYQTGIDSGISVTPTFFINNQTIIGAQDYKAFKRIINQELGKKMWWQYLLFWNN